MINCATVSGSVTNTATPAQYIISEYQKAKPVVRRFSAIGDDAACKINWFLPRAAFSFGLLENLLAAGTALKVPVDVVAGHVFKGHTITTNDKVLVMASRGWKMLSISVVTDVPPKMYCTLTVGAPGADISANTKAYIVRAADKIAGIPVLGASEASVPDLLSGDAGAPVVMELVAATSNKTTIGCAFVEYWF